jgi:hypothetical protein
MAHERIDLPQGTLDLLILKTLALEPQHGWAISERPSITNLRKAAENSWRLKPELGES